MAQVFTLDFVYRNFIHGATATVRSEGVGDFSVNVQLLGTDLSDVLPEGELNFRMSNASRRPATALRPGYNELEQSVRAAVTGYLRKNAAVKMRAAS